MAITLKKIMSIINVQNAPIHYYSYKGEINGHLMYLQSISKEKQKGFSMLPIEKQKEYVSDSAEIFIPLISTDYLAEIYKASKSHDYPYTLAKVNNIVKISKDNEPIAIALYMLLHELGHWDDFVKCGKNPYSFTMVDREEAKRVNDYRNRIQVQLNGKSELTDKDHLMLEDFVQKYYNIPFEKRANDYADRQFATMYELLKKKEIFSS